MPWLLQGFDGADATFLSRNGYGGERLGILMLHIELFHVRGNAMGVGRLGVLMLHIELLHVSCDQIYSKPVATKSTPGRLGRKQVSIIAMKAIHCVLHRELLPVCCAKLHRELLPGNEYTHDIDL